MMLQLRYVFTASLLELPSTVLLFQSLGSLCYSLMADRLVYQQMGERSVFSSTRSQHVFPGYVMV